MLLIGNDKSINAVELALTAGLLWSVEKKSLQIAGTEIILPDHIAIQRSDNDAILGVHKSGYTPMQNQQMIEILIELAHKAGLKIHSAGMFKGGARVYIQLETEGMNMNGDRIQGYLTALNSYDGSVSLSFGNSTVTISCMNTFFMAYRQMDTKIKHTASMQVRIDNLLRSVDEFRKDEQNHFEIIRKLASAPVTAKAIDTVYKGMFSVPFAEIEANNRKEMDTVSTKTMNNVARFNTAMVAETKEKGANLWGLFSGVTKYTTHMLGDNEESKMMGTVASKERALFTQLAEMVN